MYVRHCNSMQRIAMQCKVMQCITKQSKAHEIEGLAKHCTTHEINAQHSSAKHSTAQHNMVQTLSVVHFEKQHQSLDKSLVKAAAHSASIAQHSNSQPIALLIIIYSSADSVIELKLILIENQSHIFIPPDPDMFAALFMFCIYDKNHFLEMCKPSVRQRLWASF